MPTKEELQAIMDAARLELYKIEEDEIRVANLKYEGKYFKCKNSYSSSTDEGEYWWSYFRYDHLLDTRKFSISWFEKDNKGKFSAHFHDEYYYYDGMIEITKEEYNAELTKMLEQIKTELERT
jgi:hypothetical protein